MHQGGEHKPGDRKDEDVFFQEEKEKRKLLGFTVIGRSGGRVNPKSSYEESSHEI